MRKFVVVGAVAAALLMTLRVGFTVTAPGPEAPGETTVSVLGVIVKRVPDPEGRGPSTGVLVSTFAAAVGGAALVGGLLGWCVWRVCRRTPEPCAAPERSRM